MKKLFVVLLACIVLSGCWANFQPLRQYPVDPVYEAYQRGEITYADYVAHHDALEAQNYAQRQAAGQALANFGQEMRENSRAQRAQRNQQINQMNQPGSFGNPIHVKVEDY